MCQSQQFVQSFVVVVFRLLVAPLSTLPDFQISVCRQMCQFATDDLVFTHAPSYPHRKAPPHTLHVCERLKLSPSSAVIHIHVNGCRKCQIWTLFFYMFNFNYHWLFFFFFTQLLYSSLLFSSWNLIEAETAWPILFGENVYFIFASSSQRGPELNLQRSEGSFPTV